MLKARLPIARNSDGSPVTGKSRELYYNTIKDIEQGRIDDPAVLELLEYLRVKVMQYNFIGGGNQQREK